MHEKKWLIKEFTDELEIKSLADSLNISEVLARILILRNIKSFSQAKYFFRPALENLHNPFLMDGMSKATHRVIDAIIANEKITIYGDYDVDGTCSTALVYLFLKELDANVEYYIPNRLKDGYGITNNGIDCVKAKGTKLMISVDCGITAAAEIDYANSLNIDVIICDHHQPKDKIPKAYAVLDPLKPGCNYPFKYLSGAGVAFKLIQGIASKIGKRSLPMKYLDLVALAGAADIVPLIDENRILVFNGLLQINTSPRPGIVSLLQSAHIEQGKLTSGQIVFSLAPRINAVGRMSDAGIAVELLMTNSFEKAASLAQKLEDDNVMRKKVDEDTLNSALEKLESSLSLQEDFSIILHEEDWHPGVIGIVASRLAEKYYRPTIMLTTIDGVAKGSARSISNFNIYSALQKCEDLLIHFGGHQAAAGLSIEIENLAEFKTRFNKSIKESMAEGSFVPSLEIDSKVKFSDITQKFIQKINQFSPFGPQNPRPVFVAQRVELAAPPKMFGGNHILLQLQQDGCQKIFEAIGFEFGHMIKELNGHGKYFDMVFSIDEIVRDGKLYPQLRIRDLKVNQDELNQNTVVHFSVL